MTEVVSDDFANFGDTTEFSPPLKKPKTDPKVEAGADAEEEVSPERRILRRGNWDDPDYKRQREMFEEQIEKSEGYDVEWDNLDFYFPVIRFEDAALFEEEISNKQLMEMLIKTAIEVENEEEETQLEFVKYVSANVEGVQGFLFYITFWAKDVTSPNPEPKLYQAQVRKFAEEIEVHEFRLKPTQE